MSNKRKNRFTKKADKDIDDAYEHYEEISEELAEDFLDKNDELLERIRETPEQFPKVYKTVRKGLVKRFPYMVLFVMQPVENVIIGVFHQSSNPKKWKNRADENLK